MTIATLSWPEASVSIAGIVVGGLIVALLIWSIFRTGQTAIQNKTRR